MTQPQIEKRCKRVIRLASKRLRDNNTPQNFVTLVFVRLTAEYILGETDVNPIDLLYPVKKDK